MSAESSISSPLVASPHSIGSGPVLPTSLDVSSWLPVLDVAPSDSELDVRPLVELVEFVELEASPVVETATVASCPPHPTT